MIREVLRRYINSVGAESDAEIYAVAASSRGAVVHCGRELGTDPRLVRPGRRVGARSGSPKPLAVTEPVLVLTSGPLAVRIGSVVVAALICAQGAARMGGTSETPEIAAV